MIDQTTYIPQHHNYIIYSAELEVLCERSGVPDLETISCMSSNDVEEVSCLFSDTNIAEECSLSLIVLNTARFEYNVQYSLELTVTDIFGQSVVQEYEFLLIPSEL